MRPIYTEGSSSFVTSTAASVATGRSEQVPGRDSPPAVDQRLSRRTRTSHLRINCANQRGQTTTCRGYLSQVDTPNCDSFTCQNNLKLRSLPRLRIDTQSLRQKPGKC